MSALTWPRAARQPSDWGVAHSHGHEELLLGLEKQREAAEEVVVVYEAVKPGH